MSAHFVVHVDSLVPALGWALVHFLWQGALIGAATFVLLFVLRPARPQARYLVACAALALCALLPLAALLSSVLSFAPAPMPGMIYANAIVDETSLLPASGLTAWLQAHMPLLVACWCTCAGLFGLRLALGLVWIERLGRAALAPSAPQWQARLDALAHKLGLPRAVLLRVVDGIDTPIVTGCWRPMVLVPAALLSGMPVDLMEALLAHELAHVQRYDYLVNLAQGFVEAALFYHPAVWWISKQIRIEREQIADDLAAAVLADRSRLAFALQRLELFQSSFQRYAPAANGGNLMQRITRLVRPDTHALSWKAALLPAALMLACVTYAAPALTDGLGVTGSAHEVPAVPAVIPAPPALAAPAAPAVLAALPALAAAAAPAALPTLPTLPAPAALPVPLAPPSLAAPAVPAVSPLTSAKPVAPVAPETGMRVPTTAGPVALQLAQAALPASAASPVAPPAGTGRNPAAPASVEAVSTVVTSGKDIVQSGWAGNGPAMMPPRGRNACVGTMPGDVTKSLAKDLPEGASTVLNLLIGVDGKIKSTSIAHSSGSAELDDLLRAYQASCSYQPGTVDGEPAEMYTMLMQTWKKSPTDVAMTPGATVRGASLIASTCKKPIYPDLALEKRQTGTVSMNFRVGVDGKVKEAVLKRSSGTRELDVAAMDAIRLCSFKPGTSNDEPVESWTNMQYVWKLGNDS